MRTGGTIWLLQYYLLTGMSVDKIGPMATLTLSLPTATMEWLEAQAKAGGFADGREFASHILDGEREHSEVWSTAELKQIVRDAEIGGVSRRTTDEIFAEAVDRAKLGGFYPE